MTFVTGLDVNFKFYTLQMFLLSLPFQIAEHIAILTISVDGCVAATFIIIITYYEDLRINKINKTINKFYRNVDSN